MNVWELPLKDRYNREKVMQILEQKLAPKKIIELTTTLYDKRFREKMVSDLASCAEYATSRYRKVGVIGFSMGGGLSFRLAARFPQLKSCISFCGEPPKPQELQKITTPILAIYAGQDQFMNSRILGFIRDTLKQKKDLTLKIYAHAKHEFFNEMNKYDYNSDAAVDSWKITQDFLRLTLT
jgi:carboxymethylenebutenolidase